MKKMLFFFVTSFLFLSITIVTVKASFKWYIGEQFNYNGKAVIKNFSANGNFFNGLELLYKYSNNTMTIELKGERKILFFYVPVGRVKKVNVVNAAGPLNYQIVDNYYSASNYNDVKVIWKQITNGHLAANLRH